MPQNGPNDATGNASRGMEPLMNATSSVFQVRIEDKHTSRHDVKYGSPLDGPEKN